MRNHAFSLRACNERRAACGNHLWSRCKSFHDSDGCEARFRFNAGNKQDKRLSRAFRGPDRPNAGTAAHETSAYMINLARALSRQWAVTLVGCLVPAPPKPA